MNPKVAICLLFLCICLPSREVIAFSVPYIAYSCVTSPSNLYSDYTPAPVEGYKTFITNADSECCKTEKRCCFDGRDCKCDAAVTCGLCGAGWSYITVGSNNYCIKLHINDDEIKTYPDAKAACTSEAAALADFQTYDMYKAVMDTFREKTKGRKIWVGATYDATSSKWQWEEGSNVETNHYTRWESGELTGSAGDTLATETTCDAIWEKVIDATLKRGFICSKAYAPKVISGP